MTQTEKYRLLKNFIRDYNLCPYLETEISIITDVLKNTSEEAYKYVWGDLRKTPKYDIDDIFDKIQGRFWAGASFRGTVDMLYYLNNPLDVNKRLKKFKISELTTNTYSTYIPLALRQSFPDEAGDLDIKWKRYLSFRYCEDNLTYLKYFIVTNGENIFARLRNLESKSINEVEFALENCEEFDNQLCDYGDVIRKIISFNQDNYDANIKKYNQMVKDANTLLDKLLEERDKNKALSEYGLEKAEYLRSDSVMPKRMPLIIVKDNGDVSIMPARRISDSERAIFNKSIIPDVENKKCTVYAITDNVYKITNYNSELLEDYIRGNK
jgi:hypothetical protein